MLNTAALRLVQRDCYTAEFIKPWSAD